MKTIDAMIEALQSSCLPKQGLLRLSDLTETEFTLCLDLAEALKQAKRRGERGQRLAGLNVALIFEKMSTRTRAATAVAVADEGGVSHYLAAGEIHLGKKESVKDTARVLGRLFDGILFRGFEHRTVELLAEHAGVPVWNGLTDAFHPTQTLADLLTVRERFGTLAGIKLVYMGDGRNNVANSLMEGCAKTGMHFVNCTPPSLAPPPDLVTRAETLAATTGARIEVCHDPVCAVEGANVVYTDVWISMGEEAKRNERLALLRPYQVDMAMLQRTGNLEKNAVIFLHCLPAFHDHHTELTAETGAQEVTDDVFEAPFSNVFDQAENRMHTIKAMMLGSLASRPQLRKAAR